MLLQMRTFTRSWVAYLLLFVLTVAFAIWGINDVFRGVGSQDLARVGDRTIRPPQLTRELQLTLRQERNQGNNISQSDAIEAGLHLQLLERMIARYAMLEYAEKVGVSVSNASVAEQIRQIPSVANPVTGAFDEAAYDAFLQQLGFSRTEFEEEIRGEATTNMVMEALIAGVRAPSSFGALAFAYETEQRVISLAEAPASAVGQIPAPTEAQLQTFWEESQERLRVPEFRAVTLVIAEPADFVARVDVPDARLREEFEARSAALTQPERRTYVRLAAQNQQQADDAAARLSSGQAPQAVAQALGMQLMRGENQARNEVPDRGVADAVFAMQAGQARAVRGQLSPWIVVRLESVTPAVAPSFESMAGELRQAIAAQEADALLNDAIAAYDEARAGGASVAEAARQPGLRVVSIPAVEAQGRAPSGEPVALFAGQEELLRTAFATPEGEASDFLPVGDAYAVVSVDRVTPSTVRPLAEVRAQLTQVWIARERARRMRELAEDVQEAVRGGQNFAAAARGNRFSVVPPASQPIDRRTASQALPSALASQIFAAAPGDVVSLVAPDGDAVLVAHVEQINRQDPAEQPQIVEQLRGQMQQGLIQSVVQATQSEILARTNVRRNEQLLNQVFPRNNAEDEQAQ
ncbi:MAG TPA: SurA N-terminal domain-containing protein [Vitreimonas sp.]|nr:SurA N-terminal domain-containing protein [Vitreimonas sp.]